MATRTNNKKTTTKTTKPSGKHTVIVCDNGWILCGILKKETDKDLTLTDASIVRTWSNGLGIGALAKYDTKETYTLDALGEIRLYASKVIYMIPCEW